MMAGLACLSASAEKRRYSGTFIVPCDCKCGPSFVGQWENGPGTISGGSRRGGNSVTSSVADQRLSTMDRRSQRTGRATQRKQEAASSKGQLEAGASNHQPSYSDWLLVAAPISEICYIIVTYCGYNSRPPQPEAATICLDTRSSHDTGTYIHGAFGEAEM